MSIIDKINYLYTTKLDIKEAIINKGVQVSDDDTFRSYADKIENIPSGINYSNTVVNPSVVVGRPRGIDINESINVSNDVSCAVNIERG